MSVPDIIDRFLLEPKLTKLRDTSDLLSDIDQNQNNIWYQDIEIFPAFVCIDWRNSADARRTATKSAPAPIVVNGNFFFPPALQSCPSAEMLRNIHPGAF